LPFNVIPEVPRKTRRPMPIDIVVGRSLFKLGRARRNPIPIRAAPDRRPNRAAEKISRPSALQILTGELKRATRMSQMPIQNTVFAQEKVSCAFMLAVGDSALIGS
jgi:hypothetical protein